MTRLERSHDGYTSLGIGRREWLLQSLWEHARVPPQQQLQEIQGTAQGTAF